jgi:hypothetical protein
MENERQGFMYPGTQTGLTPDEKITSLFQPDTLLSAQYFDNLRRKTHPEPEKRLMVAILEDAINCFQDNLLVEQGKRKKLFDEAEAWFADTGADWIFSFENTCDGLGLNPEYVRLGLLRWKAKERLKRATAVDGERKKMAG